MIHAVATEPIAPIMETWNGIIEDVKSGKVRIANGWECSECFNSGFRYAPDPSDPHSDRYRGVVRCDHCNYWRNRRASYQD